MKPPNRTQLTQPYKPQPGVKRPAPKAVRMPPVLLDWIAKAAYVAGMSSSALIRVGARNEADRVLGYNRMQRTYRRPERPDELDGEQPTTEE